MRTYDDGGHWWICLIITLTTCLKGIDDDSVV